MAFDPNSIAQIGDSGPKPADDLAKALTLKDMLDRSQMSKLELGEKKRSIDESQQVNAILKKSKYDTPQGLAQTAAEVNKVSPRAAMDLMKTGQAYQSGQIQNQIDQLALADARQGMIVSAIDPIVAQAREMKNKGASDLDVRAFISQQ